MMTRIGRIAALSLALLISSDLPAKDRTTEEFKTYASRRIAKVDEAKLAAYVELLDKDNDGTISEMEFAARIDVYQRVFQTSPLSVRRKGHELPDNWLTDFDEAAEVAAKSGKPVLAMFSASWCGPCKMMIANVYPTDEARKGLSSFVPVYIDSEKQRTLASENSIRAFPTFICFNAEGEAVGQHVGASNVEKFLQMLATLSSAAKAEVE